VVRAPNPGPFTLDGTQTYLVGKKDVAVIDPGPDMENHVRALFDAVGAARITRILLTHGHGDHSGAAQELGRSIPARILGPPSAGFEYLVGGQRVPTDEGELEVVETPGHTADHLSFHWPRSGALFVGDLVLGRGNTTWVGEYPGCVSDYLESLERIRKLGPRVLYPGHGPPIEQVASTLDAYGAHRRERVEQVRRCVEEHPGMSPREVAEVIYGRDLPERVARAAGASVEAMIHHLRGEEKAER
jgi:glyoxylase-like metal-dependent hydrolase (beta-lactamase superfamily II)